MLDQIKRHVGDRAIDFTQIGETDFDSAITAWDTFAKSHAIGLWRTSDPSVAGHWQLIAQFFSDSAEEIAKKISDRYDEQLAHYRRRSDALTGTAIYHDDRFGDIHFEFSPYSSGDVGRISPRVTVTLTANGRSVMEVGAMRLRHGAADITPEDVDGRGIWKSLVNWHPGEGRTRQQGYNLSVLSGPSWDDDKWRNLIKPLFSDASA